MGRHKNTPEQQQAYRERQREQQRQRRERRRIKQGAGRPSMTPEQKEAARLRKKEYDRRRRPSKRQSPHEQRVKGIYVPEHVLMERAERLNAPQTPNTVCLGDPVVPRWMSNQDNNPARLTCGIGYISRFF